MHPDIKLGLKIGLALAFAFIVIGLIANPAYSIAHAIGALIWWPAIAIVGVKVVRWFQGDPKRRRP